MNKNVGRLVKIWNESEVLVDRKSKFQARCYTLQNQKDIPFILQDLIQNNKSVSKASHMHMYAWRTAEIVNELNLQNEQKKKSSKNNKKK